MNPIETLNHLFAGKTVKQIAYWNGSDDNTDVVITFTDGSNITFAEALDDDIGWDERPKE
jgi:hypothetical protein